MNVVPHPVVTPHDGHEDDGPLPGEQRDNGSKWDRLYGRLAERETYLLVFAVSHRLIGEDLGVVLVVHEGVGLEHPLEGDRAPTERVRPVHEPPVYLVLDKRHQNARNKDPADRMQYGHWIIPQARPDQASWMTSRQ